MAPTIKDIANKFGVAPSTVSNIINDRYKGSYAKTAKRAEEIKAYAQNQGYRPNAAARAVRNQRTYQVGMLLPNQPDCPHTSPNAFEGLLGLNVGLQAAGYVVSVIRLDDTTKDVTAHTKLFRERSLEALVVQGRHPTHILSEVEKLVPHTIWMDTDVWKDYNCIRRDETAAGREAVEHIISQGYRRMVWLTYPDDTNPSSQLHFSHFHRQKGALTTAEASRLDIHHLSLTPSSDISDQWHTVHESLPHDSAVVAESLNHAQMLTHSLSHAGLTAPHDFGLVCCDGSQEVDRLWPGLSRMSFDRFEMGRQAGEMLGQLIHERGGKVPSRVLRGAWVPGNTLSTQDPGRITEQATVRNRMN